MALRGLCPVRQKDIAGGDDALDRAGLGPAICGVALGFTLGRGGGVALLALPRTDPDFYPAEVMNYKLGGSFSGNVNLILREEKGYTYGARTRF
ncbi:MAG: hypothetical protein AAF503_15355, partial [Pseudomonadota bacterium]